jgi:hypothetical protein
MENQTIDKYAYKRLHSEVAELLLKPDSPARKTEEIKPLFQEYQNFQTRQEELKSLEIKLTEMIPVIEQAEVEVAKAKRQLADEEKVLGTFAEELGRSVFAGFQAGVIPDQPILIPRKELQSRIDELQAKRSLLQSQQRTGLLEKTKQQGYLLALAGQIKLEEFNVGSTDRLVGEAILASKGNLVIKCSYTEQVLKVIIEQQQRVLPARGKLKKAEEVDAQSKAEYCKKLGRTAVQSGDLKTEMTGIKKSIRQNEGHLKALTEKIVQAAVESEVLLQSPELGDSLNQLKALTSEKAGLKYHFAKGKELMQMVGNSPMNARIPWASIGSAITIVWMLFVILLNVGLFKGFFGGGKLESKTTKSANPTTITSTVSPASAGNNQNSSRNESMSSAKGSNQEIEQSAWQLLMLAATAEQQQQQLRNQQWQQQQMLRQQELLRSPPVVNNVVPQFSNNPKAAPTDPGKPCPACGGSGFNRSSAYPMNCVYCNGVGRLYGGKEQSVPSVNRLPGYGR